MTISEDNEIYTTEIAELIAKREEIERDLNNLEDEKQELEQRIAEIDETIEELEEKIYLNNEHREHVLDALRDEI